MQLNLYKHALYSFYLRMEAGADGATQQRAILRSTTSHFTWEKKIVLQIIQTWLLTHLSDGACYIDIESHISLIGQLSQPAEQGSDDC